MLYAFVAANLTGNHTWGFGESRASDKGSLDAELRRLGSLFATATSVETSDDARLETIYVHK